jgi:hypothetical protein
MGFKVNPLGFIYKIVHSFLIDELVVAMRVLREATGNRDVVRRHLWGRALAENEGWNNQQDHEREKP